MREVDWKGLKDSAHLYLVTDTQKKYGIKNYSLNAIHSKTFSETIDQVAFLFLHDNLPNYFDRSLQATVISHDLLCISTPSLPQDMMSRALLVVWPEIAAKVNLNSGRYDSIDVNVTQPLFDFFQVPNSASTPVNALDSLRQRIGSFVQVFSPRVLQAAYGGFDQHISLPRR